MPVSISEIIYQSFFDHLSQLSDVNTETIRVLKSLYASKQIANKNSLAQLIQEMETRHAQDQNSNSS